MSLRWSLLLVVALVIYLGWRAFQGTILFHLSRLACQPFESGPERGRGPGALPDALAYQSRTLFLPFEKIGPFWCGSSPAGRS